MMSFVVLKIHNCAECPFFGGRNNKTLGCEEGYCDHDDVEPGAGVLGCPKWKVWVDRLAIPSWCPLRD